LAACLDFFTDFALDHAPVGFDPEPVHGRADRQRKTVDRLFPGRSVVAKPLRDVHPGGQAGHLHLDRGIQRNAAGASGRRVRDAPERVIAGCGTGRLDPHDQQQHQQGGQDQQGPVLPREASAAPGWPVVGPQLSEARVIAPGIPFETVTDGKVFGHRCLRFQGCRVFRGY
jgi:hypothetical protein